MTTTRVTALLVSHDGARWLPAVVDGVTSQTRPVDAVVAVDTSSKDETRALLSRKLAPGAVTHAAANSSFADSVSTGLDLLPPAVDDEWIWLLHDDSNPAPDALERLLEAATPGIAVLGPKLREWPSLRRLLELGVTISGTGRRETGLERGEYDQGQHDRKRDVLAVNTAGMLVRREVLEQIGFDPRLPIFGNDLDFGWRVARAGHRIVVVPDAVVFHAEAASRGVRRTPLTGSHIWRGQRQAALYTLLVNTPGRGLPWRVVRLFFGSLLRMLGFLLVRAPGEAYDELVAMLSTYLRPHRIVRARSARRRTATVPHNAVKHLLAPAWLPYRHGLDFVSDVASAVVNQAADLTAARRERTIVETGPIDEDTQNLAPDTGVLARLVVSPVAWIFAGLFALAAFGTRGHLGGGMLSGGALLPPPETVGHWWSTAFAGWHDLGVGSTTPAAPYLLPLALAGTVLLGKAWLVLDIVFFFAVPIAAWGGFRFLRRLTGSWVAAIWGGAAYGLFPVLSGSVQQGRLGTVVVAMALPWLAHSALFLFTADTADRRWRAAFRTALWLALMSAFAPIAFALAVAATIGGLVLLRMRSPRVFADVWAPMVTSAGIALVLLLPWALSTWFFRGIASWLFEAGRPASDLIGELTALDLVLGRPGDVASAPGWLSMGFAVAALFALARSDTRGRVTGAWCFVLLGLAGTALLSGVRVDLASTGSDERLWLGVPLLVVQAAAITAIAIAGTGIREQLTGHTFGWRQLIGAVVAILAVVTPLLGLAWWALNGTDGVIDRRPVAAVPEYMTDEAGRDPSHGVLVVRGSQDSGFRYLLLRQRGLRIGDDTVLPSADEQRGLTDLVGAVASVPTADTVDALARTGVQYVYAPRPVDPELAGNLDSISGVGPASALAEGSRAWKLEIPPDAEAIAADSGSWLQPWLVGLECLAVVVAAVFAAPTRKRAAS